jgi:hypothetical protein
VTITFLSTCLGPMSSASTRFIQHPAGPVVMDLFNESSLAGTSPFWAALPAKPVSPTACLSCPSAAPMRYSHRLLCLIISFLFADRLADRSLCLHVPSPGASAPPHTTALGLSYRDWNRVKPVEPISSLNSSREPPGLCTKKAHLHLYERSKFEHTRAPRLQAGNRTMPCLTVASPGFHGRIDARSFVLQCLRDTVVDVNDFVQIMNLCFYR